MKCKYCIYYIANNNECENGKREDNCCYFQSIEQYFYICDEKKYLDKYSKYKDEVTEIEQIYTT